MTEAKCIQCGDVYTEMNFMKDFVDGICLPCQCENDGKQYEAKFENELKIFTKRTGLVFTQQEFWNACELNEVQVEDLKRLPILRDILKFCQDTEAEYQFLLAESLKPKQLTLSFDGEEDLPF